MTMKKKNEGSRGTEPRIAEALERSTAGVEPRVDRLLDGVPLMLAEARRRRAGRDALTAGATLARTAIPRLAAAAAVLVAISAALWLTRGEVTPARSSWDDVLVAGNGVSDELILGTILEPEDEP